MLVNGIAHSLGFLAESRIAAAWYGAGLVAAVAIAVDSLAANRTLNAPLKVAWPIIALFFSVAGAVLYLVTSRPPGIGRVQGKLGKMQRFTAFSRPRWRKVVASAIHCVGGDGLGIMTAMVIARSLHFSFWGEFWFEYLVGYLFGWLVFQTWAMRLHGNGWIQALWKGGRAEFFSMITVMVGMGLVMRFITPAAVGTRPLPDTVAFWMFGALGLMVGFIVTYPMNWWLVAIGWKEGQGNEYLLSRLALNRTPARDAISA